MSTPLVTSVKVEKIGNHEHVRIWVRGQLSGTLIVGPGDGARMRNLLLDGLPVAGPQRERCFAARGEELAERKEGG